MILSGGAAGPLVNLSGGAPVLSRCEWNSGLWTDGSNHAVSDGTKTWCVAQRRHVVMVACSALKLVFCAGAAYEQPQSGSVTDCLIAAAITVSCTVWKQIGNPNSFGGSPVDVMFGGATSQAMTQGELLASDAVAGLTFKRGDIAWSRTLVTVATLGDKWPINWPFAATTSSYGEGQVAGTGAPPDLLHSGSVTAVSPGTGFVPVSSLATVA